MKPWTSVTVIAEAESVAARHFKHLGILQVDADLIARQVVEPGQPALDLIKKHFGEFIILMKHGQLNRAKLRSLVFENTFRTTMARGITAPTDQRGNLSTT